MPQVSLEDQLYRSLLTSLSLTAASEKPPVSRRVTMDISTTKEKTARSSLMPQIFGSNKKLKTGANLARRAKERADKKKKTKKNSGSKAFKFLDFN